MPAATVTISLCEHLVEGTRRTSPGMDSWPMQHRLTLRRDGVIDWDGDAPGGGWYESDAIVLGSLPGNLTGEGLLWVAEQVAHSEDDLLLLLGGDDDRRAWALERVRDALAAALNGDPHSVVDAADWMVDGVSVADLLLADSPQEWIAGEHSSTHHTIDGLASWLVAHVECILADLCADEDDDLDALRAWWATRGETLR